MEEARFTAGDDLQSPARFGWSVAISGDTVVVSASQEDASGALFDTGAAYVFARNQGGINNWGRVARLTAGSDVQLSAFFGQSVAIAGDTIVVGAPGEDTTGGSVLSYAGAAYVFQRDQGGANNWGRVARLTAGSVQQGAFFGVFMVLDGDTLVVGAPGEEGAGSLPGAGAAYVFGRNQGGANAWGQVTRLIAGNPQEGASFGEATSVSGDIVVVGAPGETVVASGITSVPGAAYVFGRNQGGANAWGQVARLTAGGDAQDGAYFGGAVAVSGERVVVAAGSEDLGAGSALQNAGAAYIFERNQGGANSWGRVLKLTAGDAQAGDFFGTSVAVSGDTIAVGAFGEDGGPGDPLSGAGTVYVYGSDAGGVGAWGQLARLAASDAQSGDAFGSRVAMNQGGVILAGATGEDGGVGDPASAAGAAYAFCVDDDLEDNDSFAAALPRPAGFFPDLQICGGDGDYFEFFGLAGSTLDVTAFFSHAAGDLDMILYDANQTQLVVSNSITDNESISVVVPATGRYFIRVYGFEGALNHYDLQISASCSDDGLENNDSFGSATPMPPYTRSDLRICSGDDDYFSLTLSRGATATIAVLFTHDPYADIDVALYNSAFNLVASAESASDDELLSYEAPTDGTYYIRVYGYLGSANDYDLDVAVRWFLYLPATLRR